MGDCSKHLRTVAGVGDMKLLAEMVGDLHYATLEEFFTHLCDKLMQDSMKDNNAGREQLAEKLIEASCSISHAEHCIKQAWQISKPYMEDKK